jgi:hypothetical protein
MDPVDEAAKLSVYGPLGIYALVMTIIAIKLYVDGRRDRKTAEEAAGKLEGAYKGQLDKERNDCERERKEMQDQMRLLEERYITKAETNMEKYHALAESMNRVLESATRRYARDSSGAPTRGTDR